MIVEYSHGMKIGVTLHPYYSFVANISQGKDEIIPLIGENNNVHRVAPLPSDIKKIEQCDVIIVNGVGHDEYVFKLLKAYGKEKKIIYANENTAMIEEIVDGERKVNSHTFVSITASIQQIYHISRELGKINPTNQLWYRKNAQAYALKLRKMKLNFSKKIQSVKDFDFKCATIHSGYDYLLQEFGFSVSAVIEPAHGVKPTASQIKSTIEKIKQFNVSVIFTEMNFNNEFLEEVRKETGVVVRSFSHLCSGPFTAQSFEQGMRSNLEALAEAVEGARKR